MRTVLNEEQGVQRRKLKVYGEDRVPLLKDLLVAVNVEMSAEGNEQEIKIDLQRQCYYPVTLSRVFVSP